MQASSSSLDPVLLRRARGNQIGTVAGQIPQPPDRPRRHKTGPQHLSLGHLAQPHSVQHIGFRSTGQMFDIAGVDQPRVQPVRLQQVEHRLPVRRRRLHHHPLDAHLDQPIGQLSQRPRHRRVRRDFLQPPFTARRCRHPHTAHQLRLTDVQGRHPGNDLLLIVRFGQHRRHLLIPTHTCSSRGVVACGYRTGETNLILVLELAATVKGPNATSDARLDTRPHRTTVLDGVDRRPPHNFHPHRATARSDWLVR